MQNNGSRPQAAEVAAITGHLTHVFIAEGGGPDAVETFYDGLKIPTGALESLSVQIVAPDERNPGTITGILSRYDAGAQSGTAVKTLRLFPGTVEFIAKNRRISVTCAVENSFDDLFLRFGTDDNGVGLQADGVLSLNIVVSGSLLDARLVWAEDNREDVLFGQS